MLWWIAPSERSWNDEKTLDIKKLILLNMPYILMGLFATNLERHGEWHKGRMLQKSFFR